MGGSIDVHSSEDGGSRFVVKIPSAVVNDELEQRDFIEVVYRWCAQCEDNNELKELLFSAVKKYVENVETLEIFVSETKMKETRKIFLEIIE